MEEVLLSFQYVSIRMYYLYKQSALNLVGGGRLD